MALAADFLVMLLHYLQHSILRHYSDVLLLRPKLDQVKPFDPSF